MVIACAFAAGCTPVDTVPATFGGGELVEIKQGTTANLGLLRIGLVNTGKSDYTNDAGEKKHGLVAGLSLFISGKPPQEKRFDVYAGQTVRMGKYSVYAQEIRGGFKGSVKLRVNGADPAHNPL
ncbi:MAG: hypothetical protein A2X34_05495 [Elusimicrobia bacterium GWC2_51_8]|nr:MAG: hypothetical protein A2X33_01715 [Elusimicrobia bacterium GWA2_51_34]OGR62504.1 MAG: hypothetical protein A2X34_05495 [Elusimicrobia bacterium GWC2_51_8]OGR85546.1 MAG: hypothetical protein A2021_03180 [Elusimicrobia bacterium GWF2_52_66]HAF96246.1 hypothetical protein [Elusimicrobiota bacterium]HCE97856.1 hypothetical protein [Elusimicrobiota bacterium]